MSHTTNPSVADDVIKTLRSAGDALQSESTRQGCCVHLPARGRLLVTGDLHDNPVHFAKVVHLARLDTGDDHHLILHELIHGERLINGMDFSYRMLVRVADLVLTYPGRVHPLLANHEIAQMTNKGISKGAGNSYELFTEALSYVFDESWQDVGHLIAAFIRAWPLALRSESGLFCAHSLPNARMMGRFDPDVLDRELENADFLGPTGNAYMMTWGRQHTPEQFEDLAERWGVRLFCLGHRAVETGIERVDERAIVLNTDHERATVLPIDLAAVPDVDEAIMSAVPLGSIAMPES